MKIFEQTVNTSTQLTSSLTFDFVKEVAQSLRWGIGSKSRIILCHPSNRELLYKLLAPINNTKDINIIRPYRVICNKLIPRYRETKTDNIIFKDSKFITYSDGPRSDMTYYDYVEMCLYFGWAEYEVIKEPVWYQIDDNSFLNVIEMSKIFLTDCP